MERAYLIGTFICNTLCIAPGHQCAMQAQIQLQEIFFPLTSRVCECCYVSFSDTAITLMLEHESTNSCLLFAMDFRFVF